MNKLEENIARMEKELAAMKAALESKKHKGVALGKAEKLWWLDSGGYASTNMTFFSSSSTMRQGNFFTSKEAAEKESERRELVQKMRIAAHEAGGVDWADLESSKYYPTWGVASNVYDVRDYTSHINSSLPHFPSSESLVDFMATLTLDQACLLICGLDTWLSLCEVD